LTPEVITALDPDTTAKDLSFSVMPMGGTAEKKGYLEFSSDPGQLIYNFTQADLENGGVW